MCQAVLLLGLCLFVNQVLCCHSWPIASAIRKLPVRKWVWVIGAIVQGLCILGMLVCALTLQGTNAGFAIIALFDCF